MKSFRKLLCKSVVRHRELYAVTESDVPFKKKKTHTQKKKTPREAEKLQNKYLCYAPKNNKIFGP